MRLTLIPFADGHSEIEVCVCTMFQVSRNFGQKHAFDGLLRGSFVELGLRCGTLEAYKATSEKHGGSCNSRDPLCFPSFPFGQTFWTAQTPRNPS